MNKFTLKFQDESLEDKYQEQKLTSIRKPIYYGITGFSLLLNLMKVVLDIIRHKPLNQYFNFVYITSLLVGIFVMCKYRKYQKYAIMVPNILAGLFQLNFDEAQTMKQEFFSFGSSFAQFEAVGYFVSDVPDGLLQVVSHVIMKIVITSIKSNKVDPLATIMAIVSAFLMILVVYASDFNARKQYLSAICDSNWDEQLPYLIKKPYIQLTFQDDKYKVKQCNKLDKLPGIAEEELCFGCRARQFLKDCKVKGESLYKILLSDAEPINQQLLASLSYHRFLIKLCRFGVEKYNRIIIIEKVITKTHTKFLPHQLRNDLFKQVSGTKIECLKFYNWGMLSFILMNNMVVKQIDFFKQVQKLNNSFKRYMRLVLIAHQKYTLRTYSNLFKIFLLQVYHILILIHPNQIKGVLKDSENYLEMRIISVDSINFLELYRRNIFIQWIEEKILWAPLERDLKIKFSKQLKFR